MVTIVVTLVTGVAACNNSMPTGAEGAEGDHGTEVGESGTRYTLDQTADETNQGAHLIIEYDPTSSSFVGTVENTTG